MSSAGDERSNRIHGKINRIKTAHSTHANLESIAIHIYCCVVMGGVLVKAPACGG